MKAISEFSPYVEREFAHMVAGRLIGTGAYRKVYVNRLDEETVVKVESESGDFANVIEWEVWRDVKDHTAIAKFFAPCHFISPSGGVLIQSRTSPISFSDLPKRVPGFITDFHSRNWGLLNGRPVCHDYGNILFESDSGLKKAKFRS
jgi:hypothetical protein